jgi:hypothetical protein
VKLRYGPCLAHVFLLFLLPRHAFANEAAAALECAHEQGRGEAFMAAV